MSRIGTVNSLDVFTLGLRNDGSGFYASVDDSANTTFTARSGDVPATNEWYHIALTYDQQSLKLFVNGVIKDSVSANGNPLFNGSNGISVGKTDGTLDDLRIYDRALSAGEVSQLYRQNQGRDMREYTVNL